MLAAEAGEDGGDARHQLGEGGPALRLGVPALDHHRVAVGRGGRAESGEWGNKWLISDGFKPSRLPGSPDSFRQVSRPADHFSLRAKSL